MPEKPSEPPHFNPTFEVRQRQRLATIGFRAFNQLAADLETRLDLVLDLLSDEELHALVVPLADLLLERRHLVVLAAEPQHQHRTGIRMLDQLGQRPPRIGMVVAQLRAAVVMRVDAHIVQMRAVAFAAHPLGNGLRLPVDAPHRRHDPQLVADTHLPVAAQVTPAP